MELISSQSIYFSNKVAIPIEDVASSLLALKAIIEITPDILERIAPGLNIQKVHINLNEIKTGSLLQDVVVKFVWGSQEKLMKQVGDLRENVKMEEVMNNKKLVGCIILALILGGGLYLLTKNNGSKEQRETIQANQNIIINIGSEMAGLSAENFRAIIEGAISKNNHLAKDAVTIARPAKREEGASITMNNDSNTSITSQAIRAMPSTVPEEDSIQIVDDYADVEIQIRAIDLDSTKRGWAAVIPSIDSRRTKMHLDPHIKVPDLVGKTTIVGDVTVIFKHDEIGRKIPMLIFLRNIKNSKRNSQ